MQYGICGGPDAARAAADAGYDFFEWTVGAFLKPLEDEAAFEVALAQAKSAALPCPVVNVFLPGDLKVTGPQADLARLEQYVTTAFRRAERAGVNTIVFGSGGARRVPEGFDHTVAHQQLVAFGRMMGPLAQAHGVTIVVEHLNQAECNILTSVRESAQLVREVNQPGIQLLVDGYHWAKEQEAPEEIVSAGELIRHAHIATVPTRLPPGSEDCDLLPFFAALKRIGYDQRLSLEAKISDPKTELPRALATMQAWAKSEEA